MLRGAAWMLVAAWIFCAGAAAQSPLPEGTIVPVQISHPLDAGKVHAGQEIRVEVMQDIPGSRVERRSHVVGHVIRAEQDGHRPAELALRFDAVEVHGQKVPLTASLRALASWNEVQDAQTPEEALDRGITPEVATTRQIGGEQVYRGGGPVAAGDEAVGRPTAYGVLAQPRPNRERGCRGVVGDGRPQALWVFSTNACGVYGFPDVKIAEAGKNDPAGTIVLTAESGKLHLPSGTGMLLRVENGK